MGMEVRLCKKCLMPNSRPRITFNNEGICNACTFAEERKTWNYKERREQFIDLIKSKKRHPYYDMVIPLSGGKDSATIAYKLKYEYGFNPLGVTYAQLLWTSPGYHNWHAIRQHIDIDYYGVSQRVSRQLARRFFIERGHPKQHYDAGVNAVPVRVAVEKNIPLIVYAEHGESEYGGIILSEQHRRMRDLAECLENQIGDDPRNWATDGLTDADLYPYVYPDDIGDTEAVYFSYYNPWDIYDNAKFAKEKMGFRQARNGKPVWGVRDTLAHQWMGRRKKVKGVPNWWGKSDGTFEGFDSLDDKIDDLDFYMMHIKFGFGRATRMASRLIQRGHMTREQGLELVKRYDGEFPQTYLDDVLDYMHMTREEFDEVVEKHRNPEVWKQENGKWKLRQPPH